MKHYKIADGVISVGALGNKIFFSEENGTYAEICWRPGEADELVSKGFLKVASLKEPEVTTPAPAIGSAEETTEEAPAELPVPVQEPEKKEAPEQTSSEEGNEPATEKAAEPIPSLIRKIEDIDIKELRLYLIGKSIKFNPNASKAELYQLYVDSFKQ